MSACRSLYPHSPNKVTNWLTNGYWGYVFSQNHSQNHFFTHTRPWRVLCIFKKGQKNRAKLAIFWSNFRPASNLFDFNLYSNLTIYILFLYKSYFSLYTTVISAPTLLHFHSVLSKQTYQPAVSFPPDTPSW